MQEGTVKFFNDTKGYGFITPAEGGKEIFVHTKGLIDQIKDRDKVTFEVDKDARGQFAVNVQRVDKPGRG